MCDVKTECEKRVEKQDAFSVSENECSSSPSLERHVGDSVDENIETVSVDAELVEHPQLVPHEEDVTDMTPPGHPGRDSSLQFFWEFWRLM